MLVLRLADRVDQVDAESVRRTARTWHAAFAWDGDPSAIREATLEVGDRLTVDLGPHPSKRRRLGRTTRPVLALVANPSPAPDAGAEDGMLSVHAALVAAREDLAQATDEVEVARQQARRAREDADRERERRQHEAGRHHDALNMLKRVAAEAVGTERDRLQEQTAEIERLKEALAVAAGEAAGAQQQADASVRERAQIAESARAEIESSRGELAQAKQEIGGLRARQSELSILLSDTRTEAQRVAEVEAKHEEARRGLVEARRVAEGLHNEAVALRTKLAQLEKIAAAADAEVGRLQAELEQTQQMARRTTRELERAGEEVREARRLREAVGRLEAGLAEARRAWTDAAADAASARDRLEAVRAALADV